MCIRDSLYAVTHALTLYARAVALANLGRDAEARENAAAFTQAHAAIPEERMLFQNKARDVLDVAEAMMWGEISFKSGDIESGLDHLRTAVTREESLLYEEPWAWPQPTRHALGALLMDAGHYSEAEAVYRADLGSGQRTCAPLSAPAQCLGLVWFERVFDPSRRDRGATAYPCSFGPSPSPCRRACSRVMSV